MPSKLRQIGIQTQPIQAVQEEKPWMMEMTVERKGEQETAQTVVPRSGMMLNIMEQDAIREEERRSAWIEEVKDDEQWDSILNMAATVGSMAASSFMGPAAGLVAGLAKTGINYYTSTTGPGEFKPSVGAEAQAVAQANMSGQSLGTRAISSTNKKKLASKKEQNDIAAAKGDDLTDGLNLANQALQAGGQVYGAYTGLSATQPLEGLSPMEAEAYGLSANRGGLVPSNLGTSPGHAIQGFMNDLPGFRQLSGYIPSGIGPEQSAESIINQQSSNVPGNPYHGLRFGGARQMAERGGIPDLPPQGGAQFAGLGGGGGSPEDLLMRYGGAPRLNAQQIMDQHLVPPGGRSMQGPPGVSPMDFFAPGGSRRYYDPFAPEMPRRPY